MYVYESAQNLLLLAFSVEIGVIDIIEPLKSCHSSNGQNSVVFVVPAADTSGAFVVRDQRVS